MNVESGLAFTVTATSSTVAARSARSAAREGPDISSDEDSAKASVRKVSTAACTVAGSSAESTKACSAVANRPASACR